MDLPYISLFTGIGGIDLAAERAGFKTVLMVENNKYCRKVLKMHWPGVPILEDIFDVNKETIQEAMANANSNREVRYKPQDRKGGGIEQESEEPLANTESGQSRQQETRDRGEDIGRGSEENRGTGGSYTLPPITLLTGGFPCQPFSVAGKRRGKEDDRYLWPEMLRVIKEIRPRWVVAENVAGLIRMGLDDCLSDLESAGYITETFLIPACAVNAPHRRDRIFIVAHAKGNDAGQPEIKPSGNKRQNTEANRLGLRVKSGRPSEDVADSSSEGLEERESIPGNSGEECQAIERGRCSNGEKWWTVEPGLGGRSDGFSFWLDGDWERGIPRVTSGTPHRTNRLKALGNAVVPAQIYPILKAIADIENTI